MSATIVEDIIASHAGRGSVAEGDLVTARVDRVYLQDGNSPTVSKLFERHGFDRVFDRDRVGIFFDHSVIAPDKHIAARLREGGALRREARGQGLPGRRRHQPRRRPRDRLVRAGHDRDRVRFAHLHGRRDAMPRARHGRLRRDRRHG